MENASKALLIAGGVLIAILVISVGAYLFLSASGVSENFDKSMSDSDIEKFNQKFEEFEKIADFENGVYNAISDVVSAVNLANDINRSVEYDAEKGVQVVIQFDGSCETFGGSTYGINPILHKALAGFSNKSVIYKISGTGEEGSKKIISIGSENKIQAGDEVSPNELLDNFSESKMNGLKRVYEYGADGKVYINDSTGMIDRVYFLIKKNTQY